MKKISVLVDGSNMYSSLKALGWQVDYKKLLDMFPEDALLRAYYFTALAPETEQSTLRPMVDWMEYNRWTVIQKPIREFIGDDGKTKIKGNMDIEISVIAQEIAPMCDHILLFSGDGDFRFMLESIQRRYSTRITVVSTIQTSPSMCSDDLRRQADDFIDLNTLRSKIEREDASRPARVNRFLERKHG